MKLGFVLLVLVALCAGIIASSGQAFAQQYPSYGGPPPSDYGQQNQQYGYGQYGSPYGQPYPPMGRALGDRELRNLVAPIALYPDPLIGLILPAATYVDDIIDCDQRNLGNDEIRIQRQRWDISVKALAHYPDVIHMLARDPDWCAALGQAYVYQPSDLMDAIQYLRQRAWDNGVLRSSRYQTVYRDQGYIRILPVQGNYIYVPQYDPDVVYLSRRPNYGPQLLTFGLGLLIGSWLDNDTDWHRHRIYRHGWEGSGWYGKYHGRFGHDKYYVQDRNFSILGNHDIIRRSVDFGKVKTYRLPGVVRGPPLNYPKGSPGGDNQGGHQGGNQGDHQGGNQGDHQGGNQGDHGGNRGGDQGGNGGSYQGN